MNKLKIQTKKEDKRIDWSKPQWVQNIEDNSLVVLTNGEHGVTNFWGAALPCDLYPNGNIYKYWEKSNFKPLKGDILFIISNNG